LSVNFSNTTPTAVAGGTNILWQTDGSGNISGYVPSGAAVVFSTLQPTLTANYNAGSAMTLFTPSVAGAYRISVSQAIQIAAGTSSTFPSLTLSWTDVGSVARTKQLVATSATNTTAVESDTSVVIYTNNSTAVQVTSASYASNPASAMTYALTIVAEAL
jgi:hypothetical protein